MRIFLTTVALLIAVPASAEPADVAFNKCKMELLKNPGIKGDVTPEYVDGNAGRFVAACMISRGWKQRTSIRGEGDRLPNIAWACDNLTMPECFESPPAPSIKETVQAILHKLGW
jgi:hypothetical protein